MRKILVLLLLLPILAHATASIRGEKATAWTATAATSVTTPSLSSAALVGDTEEVWVICSCSTQPTVTDSASQTYTFRLSGTDNNSGVTIYLFTHVNNSSATALTATATWGSAQTYNGIWLRDITGVSTSPYQTSVALNQCSPSGCTATAGTGPGAITSGNITPTSQPALISSISWDDGGNFSSTVNTSGGITGITGWLLSGATAATTTSSSVRVTSTSTTAMTYTNATDGGTRHFITMAASYTEAGSSCTHAGYTSAGATATPNGTTGSYWLKNGTFGTPDCSTTQYWQPAVGNFGTN